MLAGRRPPDVRVAEDYPTEFSRGIVRQAGGELAARPAQTWAVSNT